MQDAMQKNSELRATLAGLKAERGAAPTGQSETQAKAQAKLQAVELSKLELKHQQTIELKELQVKQLLEEIKEARDDLKNVQKQIDATRSQGKAVWETVGIGTVQYTDPFHTGLSKRTPTGGYFTS